MGMICADYWLLSFSESDCVDDDVGDDDWTLLNYKKGELDDKQYTEAQLYRNCNCHKYQIHNPHIRIAICTHV